MNKFNYGIYKTLNSKIGFNLETIDLGNTHLL